MLGESPRFFPSGRVKVWNPGACVEALLEMGEVPPWRGPGLATWASFSACVLRRRLPAMLRACCSPPPPPGAAATRFASPAARLLA